MRVLALFSCLLPLLAALPLRAQFPPGTNVDEARVPAYELPPLLPSGVRASAEWERAARPMLLDAFSSEVYGRTPTFPYGLRAEILAETNDAVGGLAVRRLVRLRFFEDPSAPFVDFMVYLPKMATGPVPFFLGLNYFGNESIEPDPSIPLSSKWMGGSRNPTLVEHRSNDANRGYHRSRWPLALALQRGYGVATFYYGDIEPDHPQGWREGLRGYLLRQEGREDFAETDWGSLGAWAWGLSRALDYLLTLPEVDPRRVIVFGHSRHGKAALWAGAQDPRFAMVVANCSGNGGAALLRREFGENVSHSISMSGRWYARRFAQYVDNVAKLPVDAHMLLALIAPRPLYVASADQDLWADPRGEFLAAQAASEVYALYGEPGLAGEAFPAAGEVLGKWVGYHLRSGRHDITAWDWERFIVFADEHLPAH